MNQLFFKYFIKQKIFFLFFIFITLFGVAISLNSQFENKNSTKKEISHYEQVIDVNKQDIEQIDEELKNVGNSEEDINDLYNSKKHFLKVIETYEMLIKNVKTNNWKGMYEYEMSNLKDSDGQFTIYAVNNMFINELTVEISYETLKYLKDSNISSAYPLSLQRTEFDQPRTSEESKYLDDNSKKTLIGTSHRLWDFFTNNLVLIYTFIIVVTFGILFSKLEDSQNKTIRFLKTSGASKFRIVSSGLFTGGILTIILGLLIPAIFFGIEFLISGSSSFKYPITTYIVKNDYYSLMSFGYKIVPISDVLTKSLILFLLYGLFIFLFTSAISTFVKSSVKSVILSFGLIATLQMFNKWYNPFSYWRVGKIADGSINILSKTVTYSFNKSCKILVIGICILTILLICIAFIQDRRRNGYA